MGIHKGQVPNPVKKKFSFHLDSISPGTISKIFFLMAKNSRTKKTMVGTEDGALQAAKNAQLETTKKKGE
jgi:hypothetical protein